MKHLVYFGSLLAMMAVGIALCLSKVLPLQSNSFFFFALYWFHMALGHWLGYSDVLVSHYTRGLSWFQDYQHHLILCYSLVGLAFLIASFTSVVIGYSVIALTIIFNVIHFRMTRRKLEEQHSQTPPSEDSPQDTIEKD